MTYILTSVFSYEESVRKSRFLAWAAPIRDSSAALAFIGRYADPGATHNCWAWKIGQNYRFNDDGEPGGTAGRPILQAIEGQQIDQVAVLVVRWFGGIKLGTGGLARAYAKTASQCLRLAPKQQWVALSTLFCWCPFSDMALVQSRFNQFGVQTQSEQFDHEGVTWQVQLPTGYMNDFSARFMDLTKGQGRLKKS